LPEGKLMGFYPHVGELSKVLIEGGHRCVFGRRGRGQQAAASPFVRSMFRTGGSATRPKLSEGPAFPFNLTQ